MAQTSYDNLPALGFPGLPVDSGFKDAVTRAALGPVPFGRFVLESAARTAALVSGNVATVTASTDLVTSNSTVGTVTVTDPEGNATETDLTATVFATDHATTLAAIATKIAAIDGIASAEATAASDLITVTAERGYSVVLSAFVTTGGAGQPTWSYTQTGSLTGLAGVSLHQHKEPDSAGVAQYLAAEAVDVLKRGRVWVQAEQAVIPGDPVYVRVIAGSAGELVGQVRKDADSGKAVLLSAGAAFDSDTSAAGLVSLSLNLP